MKTYIYIIIAIIVLLIISYVIKKTITQKDIKKGSLLDKWVKKHENNFVPNPADTNNPNIKVPILLTIL